MTRERQPVPHPAGPPRALPSSRTSTPAAWLAAAALVAAAAALAWVARTALAVPDVEMLFLLAVVLAAVRLGRGPALLTAALGVAVYDFLFVPPAFTFAVHEAAYLLTFVMMFGIGAVTSSLTARLRQEQAQALQRERRAAAQYALSSALADAAGAGAVGAAATRLAAEEFGASATLLAKGRAGALEALATAGQPPDEPLLAWARSAFANVQATGLPDGLLCLPLLAGVEPVAVLAVRPWEEPAGDPGRRPFLEALGRQVASALERIRLAGLAREAAVRAAAEEQRSALLSTVSHDLRTPLAVITGAASALRGDPALGEAQRRELLDTVCEEAERLERLVGNLLDMTRLQGAQVALRREWVPLDELAGAALSRLERELGDRPVRIELGAAPLVAADPVLLERLLANLLENAAKYTPPGSPLELTAAAAPGAVVVELADRGPGVPPGDEERVFERFHRGTHPGVGGAGLGLAIARAIARAHGGELTVANRPGGGAIFRLVLPQTGEPPAVASDPPTEAP